MPDEIGSEQVGEHRTTHPSGIVSVVHWRFADGGFRVTGQDFSPGGGEYEYIATIHHDHLPSLAAALDCGVADIEAVWAARIAEIDSPGFVSWLRAQKVEFEFFTWRDMG